MEEEELRIKKVNLPYDPEIMAQVDKATEETELETTEEVDDLKSQDATTNKPDTEKETNEETDVTEETEVSEEKAEAESKNELFAKINELAGFAENDEYAIKSEEDLMELIGEASESQNELDEKIQQLEAELNQLKSNPAIPEEDKEVYDFLKSFDNFDEAKRSLYGQLAKDYNNINYDEPSIEEAREVFKDYYNITLDKPKNISSVVNRELKKEFPSLFDDMADDEDKRDDLAALGVDMQKKIKSLRENQQKLESTLIKKTETKDNPETQEQVSEKDLEKGQSALSQELTGFVDKFFEKGIEIPSSKEGDEKFVYKPSEEIKAFASEIVKEVAKNTTAIGKDGKFQGDINALKAYISKVIGNEVALDMSKVALEEGYKRGQAASQQNLDGIKVDNKPATGGEKPISSVEEYQETFKKDGGKGRFKRIRTNY